MTKQDLLQPPLLAAQSKWHGYGAPVAISVVCLFVGLFFMRPNMGEPDSYREALSAFKYIDEGVYSSYWDHPLTMYFFVAGTRISRALGVEQTTILNLLAVLFGVSSVWPFFHLTEKLVRRKAAFFASLALILSPTFIEFSTYLSHEIIGFAFALWTLFLFARLLESRRRLTALAFGSCFAATWCARPSGVFFISPPLLVLFLFHVKEKKDFLELLKSFLVALPGIAVCLAAVYRPALVAHLKSYSSNFLFTYYDFGRYYKSSSLIALSALTPVLSGFLIVAAVFLAARRRYLTVIFAGSWILTAFTFYTGMYSMNRYFLVLLPPSLFMVFVAADEVDLAPFAQKIKMVEPAKCVALFLLFAAALGPNLSDLVYARSNNDDKEVSRAVGQAVGRNLLFTTAPEPMLLYYNQENPPETVYLITEYSPGTIAMKMDMLREAQRRLRDGREVFMTGEIVRHLEYVQVDAEYELVFEFRFRKLNRNFNSLQLFRLTNLRFVDGPPHRTG